MNCILNKTICLASIFVAGAVFDSEAATYKLLHPFNGPPGDGANPWYGASLANSGSTLYGMTKSGGAKTNGVIFKISISGAGYQVLHSFDGYDLVFNPGGSPNDGATPYGTPVVSGSTLYGMTWAGGSNSFGTVFSMSTDGSAFQVLHHFGASGDGSMPSGSSLIISGSTLYGMTSSGGTNGAGGGGTVFRIESNGSDYRILHHFGPGDATGPWGSLALSGTTLYGMTTSGGGIFQAGVVFRIETNGDAYQIIHEFTGVPNDGSHPNGSLVVSGSTLFGMTYSGGASNVGAIFQVQTNGDNFQLMHSFAPQNDGFSPWGDLTLSGTTLFGMTYAGGTGLGLGSVFQIDTDGGNYRILHTFRFPLVANDGQFPFGSLLQLGSTLYGMTDLGGGPKLSGCIFSLALGSNVVDATPPVLTVLTPKQGQRVSNEVFTATGRVTDNAGVARVYYQLNNGGWNPATGSNSWSAGLTLLPGTNIFKAYAEDTGGNLSRTNTVKLVYVLSDILTVEINGRGVIVPNYNGRLLAISNKYTMTAQALPGFRFQGWSGDVASPQAKLTFLMRSNLTLTANFVDISRPVDAVILPRVNGTLTNSPFTATGKAADNVGVSAARYQLNGAGWASAATTNAFTNWTAPELGLLSGTNVLQAFAEDAAGNRSLTNTVKFKYKVVPASEWAPDSLNGLLLEATPFNGALEDLTFDLVTFAQAGQAGDTNSGNFSVGGYLYSKSGTNSAQLALTNTAPTTRTNDSPFAVDLIFTNHYQGVFTNAGGETGTFKVSVSTALVPANLAGRTVVLRNASGGAATTIALAKNGTFVKTPAVGKTTGTSVGAYTSFRVSPVAVFLEGAFSGADAGTTVEIQLLFTSTTAGRFFVTLNTGAAIETNSGSFILK